MIEDLKPCPKCGKQPHVYLDRGALESGYGAWITIECKPFFRKAHLKIEEGKSTPDRCLNEAIAAWNRRAT